MWDSWQAVKAKVRMFCAIGNGDKRSGPIMGVVGVL